ncbi:nucleoside-diphosphate sugar epimerase/dehydratase [Nesterenkonia massiliensis]|uniref:nucleoside-diphosphate sugar epimerase/dehydratase n=1 Tax=Nesterenkonia massiliensis TaxID=1232429 RepID=UPI0006776E66|nr:nucleoside-diphosphate sugar epimerase/dehydratase [Nesterenkonia massiliensis]
MIETHYPAPEIAAPGNRKPAKLARGLRKHKNWLQILLDAIAWILAATLVGLASENPWTIGLTFAVLIAIVLHPGMLRLYGSRLQYGSLSEYGALVALTVLLGCVFLLVHPTDTALAVLMVTASLVLMSGTRWLLLYIHQRTSRPRSAERVLIIGAGDATESLVRQMLSDPAGPYLPVGLIDDDPRKRQLSIQGVRVRGNSEDVADLVDGLDVAGVIVAIADSKPEFLAACRERLRSSGCWLRTIPPLADLVNRRVDVSDIRDLKVEDLIGRSPIHTDMTEIRAQIQGKRVLVTGAGGSIGSELCRQLWDLEPESLVLLDRDETALHGVELALYGSALLTSPNTVLADIRDQQALDRIFAEARPQIVFHAAALKHLPVLERFPQEAWKTNVHGTLNVLRAAESVGVETFVNISTDKAASPTSELGRSKRVAERLVSGMTRTSTGTYLSVRFGNVLGSRGSVLLSFQEQIRQGGPVTVTDPEVTRYFMTIPEACQLVLQAATIGQDGYVMVLDMGEPVKIVDIARNLIAMSNTPTDIVFTGLRAGEKLEEELFGNYEGSVMKIHDKISRVEAPDLEARLLPATDASRQEIELFYTNVCTGPLPQLVDLTRVEAIGESHAA